MPIRFQPMWAVARNLIVEFWRMRTLTVLVALLLAACTALLAAWLYRVDARKDEQVQTLLSYSLSGIMTLLSLTTIFLSILTVTRDIKRKEVFTVLTKPVSRPEYLAGKFAGLCLLNLVLLSLTGALIYGLAWYPVWADDLFESGRDWQNTWRWRVAKPFALDLNEEERARLLELVLVARQPVLPDMPDITREVSEQVEKEVAFQIKADARYQTAPELVNLMRATLTKDIALQKMNNLSTVPPNRQKTWKFTGLRPIDREQGFIVIRYKKQVSRNPEDMKTTDLWAFGPQDPLEAGGMAVPAMRNEIRTFHEFALPASAVSPAGDLYLTYGNPADQNQDVSIQFEANKGLEALYLAGSFGGNLLRGLLLIFLRLALLAALGVAMGAWLSFPVAALLVMVVYAFGISSSFLLDAAEWNVGVSYRNAVSVFLSLLPALGHYDPVAMIQAGRVVPDRLVQNCLLYMILVKGGLVSLFGLIVFKFRELAQVIV